jgi:hypothetical protein
MIESLKGPSGAEAIDFKNVKINVYGNTATVIADVDYKSGGNGTSSLSRLNVLHVLVKGPQGWQMVARQAVRYADAPAR